MLPSLSCSSTSGGEATGGVTTGAAATCTTSAAVTTPAALAALATVAADDSSIPSAEAAAPPLAAGSAAASGDAFWRGIREQRLCDVREARGRRPMQRCAALISPAMQQCLSMEGDGSCLRSSLWPACSCQLCKSLPKSHAEAEAAPLVMRLIVLRYSNGRRTG